MVITAEENGFCADQNMEVDLIIIIIINYLHWKWIHNYKE